MANKHKKGSGRDGSQVQKQGCEENAGPTKGEDELEEKTMEG